MTGRMRQVLGLVVLAAVAVVVLMLQRGGFGLPGSRPDPVTVRGTIGSEKAGFLDDPAVKKLLLDRYGITADYRRTGSINLVTASPGGQDSLWPGSQYARDLFEQAHGAPPRAEV